MVEKDCKDSVFEDVDVASENKRQRFPRLMRKYDQIKFRKSMTWRISHEYRTDNLLFSLPVEGSLTPRNVYLPELSGDLYMVGDFYSMLTGSYATYVRGLSGDYSSTVRFYSSKSYRAWGEYFCMFHEDMRRACLYRTKEYFTDKDVKPLWEIWLSGDIDLVYSEGGILRLYHEFMRGYETDVQYEGIINDYLSYKEDFASGFGEDVLKTISLQDIQGYRKDLNESIPKALLDLKWRTGVVSLGDDPAESSSKGSSS